MRGNEGRSTFLIEILYRNFQSRGVACCFILSSFSIMKLPLITALCAELPPGGGSREIRRLNCLYQRMGCAPHHRPNGQSLPPGGSREMADNFCRKMKFAEFFSGKGKPRNAAFKWFVSENKLRPSSPRFARSFPPRGSLDKGKP